MGLVIISKRNSNVAGIGVERKDTITVIGEMAFAIWRQ